MRRRNVSAKACGIGGVPPLLIFDNATGVGKRVGSQVHETELFRRFRAHYGCRVKFCNPYAGYEKGNVERKVDYVRANLWYCQYSFAKS